jgi:hypothetical protein
VLEWEQGQTDSSLAVMFSAVPTADRGSRRCSAKRSGEVPSDVLNVRVLVANVNVRSVSRSKN